MVTVWQDVPLETTDGRARTPIDVRAMAYVMAYVTSPMHCDQQPLKASLRPATYRSPNHDALITFIGRFLGLVFVGVCLQSLCTHVACSELACVFTL